MLSLGCLMLSHSVVLYSYCHQMSLQMKVLQLFSVCQSTFVFFKSSFYVEIGQCQCAVFRTKKLQIGAIIEL